MRAFKKITALFIALAVMASMFTMPAFAEIEFNDVDETTAFYDAIMDLVDQGVINGYNNDDGTTSFKPEATINRAEFTKMLVVASVADESVLTGTTTSFSDVANDFWAVPYIAYATQAKIINGYEDGTFRTDNPVTFAEAVKMIVCSLGYTEAAIGTSDPWYDVYISTGKSIGVTKGALAPADTAAQRGMIAQLIRNMLDCAPLEFAGYDSSGKEIFKQAETTYQDSVLNSQSAKGIFMGYYENTITGSEEGLTLSEVFINNQKYKLADSMKNTDFSPYLGKAIVFTYNNKNEITSIKNDSINDTVIVDCDDIYELNGNVFTYYDDNYRDVDVRVENNPYVIYNGKSVSHGIIDSTWLAQYAMAECGDITFLSNDEDSAYEVLFINSYDTYFVNKPIVSKGVYTVTDKNDLRQVVLDEDDCTVTRVTEVGGKQSSASLSSIYANSVISVAKPLGTTQGTSVVCSTAKVTGTVSGMSEYNTVTVNSKEYDITEHYRNLVQSDSAKYGYSIGDNITLYFDFKGNVYHADVSATSIPYGYIIAAAPGTQSGFDGHIEALIMTATGSKTPYKLKSQVKVDGQPMSSTAALGVLKANAAIINANKPGYAELAEKYKAQQLVKYKTGTENGETVISEFYTTAGEIKPFAYKTTADEAQASPYTDVSTRKLKYFSSGYKFSSTDDAVSYFSVPSSVVFVVPADRASETNFKKGNYSQFQNKTSYYVEAYDVEKNNAGVIVKYLKSSQDSAPTISVSAKAVIIQSIIDSTNKNGDDAKMLQYIEVGKNIEFDNNGKQIYETAYTENMETLNGVAEGDVIKIAKEDGLISGYQLVYKASEEQLYTFGTDVFTPVVCNENYFTKAYNSITDYYQVMHGTVLDVIMTDANSNTGVVNVAPAFAVYDGTSGQYTIDDSKWEGFNLKGTTTKYYTVDVTAKGDKITYSESPSLNAANDYSPEHGTKVLILVFNKEVLGVVTYVD